MRNLHVIKQVLPEQVRDALIRFAHQIGIPQVFVWDIKNPDEFWYDYTGTCSFPANYDNGWGRHAVTGIELKYPRTPNLSSSQIATIMERTVIGEKKWIDMY